MMVPQDEPWQPVPDIVQVRAVFWVPVTLAMNCCYPFTGIVTEVGDMVTLTPLACNVTIAVPLVPSMIDMAVTVTVGKLGTLAGAL